MLRSYIPPFIIGLTVIFFGSFVVTYFGLDIIYPHIDKLMHISGGFIVAWFFSRLWANKLTSFNNFERLILCIALGVMIGLAWEFMEYIASLSLFDSYYYIHQYVYIGNITDTLGDLLADVFGGALFGFFSRSV